MPNVATSLLPATIRPTKYEVTLSPDLVACTFTGEETVDIEVRQSTAQIVLNAAELEIHEASVVQNGQRLPAERIEIDAEAETATLTFARPPPTGTMQLSLRFSGVLNDK